MTAQRLGDSLLFASAQHHERRGRRPAETLACETRPCGVEDVGLLRSTCSTSISGIFSAVKFDDVVAPSAGENDDRSSESAPCRYASGPRHRWGARFNRDRRDTRR
jgi:hypothetical protein